MSNPAQTGYFLGLVTFFSTRGKICILEILQLDGARHFSLKALGELIRALELCATKDHLYH